MRRILSAATLALAIPTLSLADDTKPAADAAPAAPTTASPAAPPEAKPAEAAAPAPLEVKPIPSAGDEVNRVFPIDGEQWMKDPFLVLTFEMEAVVDDFQDGKSTPPAETTQPRIVSRFDAVIEQLEKKRGGTGGGPGGLRPAEQSTLAKGPGGMGELKTPKKSGKGYDDLTPKEREKILQSKTEGFPPGFEDVLADYYRRLAKAEGASTEPASDPPAARPDSK